MLARPATSRFGRNYNPVACSRDKLWIHCRLAIQNQNPCFAILKEPGKLNQVKSILSEDIKRVKHISC